MNLNEHEAAAWHDGNCVVAQDGTTLPARCVKTNEEELDRWITQSFHCYERHSSEVAYSVLANQLAGPIGQVLASTGKKKSTVRISYGIGTSWANAGRRFSRVAILTFLSGIFGFFCGCVGIASGTPYVGIAMLMFSSMMNIVGVGLLVVASFRTPVTATQIEIRCQPLKQGHPQFDHRPSRKSSWTSSCDFCGHLLELARG